jgi:hypothetical protein
MSDNRGTSAAAAAAAATTVIIIIIIIIMVMAFTTPSPTVSGSISLERRVYKNITTENGPYDTISTTHNSYYPKKITRKFKTA